MSRTPRQKWMVRASLPVMIGVWLTARALPVAASFSLDSTSSGRIWVPDLVVDTTALTRADRSLALLGFADCTDESSTIATLAARERDCRFEQQLAATLMRSGLFRDVVMVRTPQEASDIVLIPQRTRVQFHREVIPAAKPFLVLSLFTYLWTPLPYERDTETYQLRFTITDRHNTELAQLILDREFTHSLSTYAGERSLPPDLIAALKAYEQPAAGATTCNGPHSGIVVREFLEALHATVLQTAQFPPTP